MSDAMTSTCAMAPHTEIETPPKSYTLADAVAGRVSLPIWTRIASSVSGTGGSSNAITFEGV